MCVVRGVWCGARCVMRGVCRDAQCAVWCMCAESYGGVRRRVEACGRVSASRLYGDTLWCMLCVVTIGALV